MIPEYIHFLLYLTVHVSAFSGHRCWVPTYRRPIAHSELTHPLSCLQFTPTIVIDKDEIHMCSQNNAAPCADTTDITLHHRESKPVHDHFPMESMERRRRRRRLDWLIFFFFPMVLPPVLRRRSRIRETTSGFRHVLRPLRRRFQIRLSSESVHLFARISC